MSLRIDPRIFATYPDLLVGTIVVGNLTNGAAPAELTELLRDAESALRARIPDAEALKAHPNVAAWQAAHRAFGSNPNKYPPSVQALAKRVVNGKELPAISALVDAYNVVSLRHLLPVGGEDLGRCVGDVVLTFAEGGEDFTPLGEEGSAPPEKGEVVYRDDVGVICRRFNWREAARTCLTHETTDAILVIEALPPATRGELDAALGELQQLVERFCANRQSPIANRQPPIRVTMSTLIHHNTQGDS